MRRILQRHERHFKYVIHRGFLPSPRRTCFHLILFICLLSVWNQTWSFALSTFLSSSFVALLCYRTGPDGGTTRAVWNVHTSATGDLCVYWVIWVNIGPYKYLRFSELCLARLILLFCAQPWGEELTAAYLCAHHLWKQVPVVAVNLWREVVDTQHIVCTVGQDTGTIRGPSLTLEGRRYLTVSTSCGKAAFVAFQA